MLGDCPGAFSLGKCFDMSCGNLETSNSLQTAPAFGLTRVRMRHFTQANETREALQIVGEAQLGHG